MNRHEVIRRLSFGLIGATLIGQSAIMGIVTVDALKSSDDRPEELIFQDVISERMHGNTGEYSNFELLNGFTHNVVAATALLGAGVTLLDRALSGSRHRENSQ